MEYAPLEKRPDQPETNTRTDAGRFVGDTFIPAAEPEDYSVFPYMPGGLHVRYGMSHSEQEAMRWQAHFGRSSGNPLLDALNPFARRLDTGENEDASSSANTSPTISRAPAVQAVTAEEGFPLNKAQTEKVDTALAETGQPLLEPEKAVYEAHTGHDFSRVRVHTGSAAEEAADSIGAKAFAKGNDIVFAKDEYNPSTAEGRGLIGHELAHVAQSATGVHRAPKKNEGAENARTVSFAIESSEENILTIGAEATFTLRQKTAWIVNPGEKTSVKWFIKNQGTPERELKQVDYHPYERHLSATDEGVHQIIARVYLNNQLKEEVVYLQRVVKVDSRILKMSVTEKMRLAMERSQVWEEIKNEVGDPVQLIAMMIATIAILTLIAETGFGFAAEVLAGIIAALALGVSVKGLFEGIVNLVEFAKIIGYAGTEHDIDKASGKFAEGVAKIGVHTLFLLLLYLGVRKNSTRVKLQLEKAKVNGKPGPELKPKTEIKDAEEVKDLLPEGKRPEQARRPPEKSVDEGKTTEDSKGKTDRTESEPKGPEENLAILEEPEVWLNHIMRGEVNHTVTFKGIPKDKLPAEIAKYDGQRLTPEILETLAQYDGKNGFSLRTVLKSEAKGGHHPLGDSITILERIAEGPMGSFKAKISVYDPIKKTWKTKKDESSMFSEDWSAERIKAEILSAWRQRIRIEGSKWWGKSASGLIIEGWTNGDGTIHGYPFINK